MGVDDWISLVRRMAADRRLARDKLRRAVGFARAVPLFRGCELGSHVCAAGFVRVRNEGQVMIGDRVTFSGGMLSTALVCGPDATLEIGDDCTFNYGVYVDSAKSVRIGRRCMVASMVRISDSQAGHSYPVSVGDNVWIAHGAIIEPGVTVGDGSVIAAGSVVTRDVPADSLAIGNPARSMTLEVVA